jgi:phage gp45-like
MGIDSLLAPLYSAIRLVVGRAFIVKNKATDAGLSADIELLSGEKRRSVEIFQQPGFVSRTKGDADAIALFVGGSRDNGAIIAQRDSTDVSAASEIKDGERLMISPFGQKIKMNEDGSITLCAKSGCKIYMESDVEMSKTLVVTGEITTNAVVGGVTLSGHIHPSGVGPTGSPTAGS